VRHAWERVRNLDTSKRSFSFAKARAGVRDLSVIASIKTKTLPDAAFGTNTPRQSLHSESRCNSKKTQLVVGGVNNDTGIGLSHSMSALSPHSRVTQQLPGTGEDGLCKCLYIFELFDCHFPWAGTDQASPLTASNG
jgi:hypothetical protein